MLIWDIHVDYKLFNQRQHDVISPGRSVKRYQLRDTPDDFLSFSNIDPLLYEKITAIEGNLQCQKDVQRAYNDFLELIKTEMDNRIPCKKTPALNFDIKKNNRTRKPYWNDELAAQWSHARNCEKLWLQSNSHANKGKLKSEFCQARKCFDQLHRKVKRQYRQKLQDELSEKFECTNSTEFWKTIGEIGISKYRQNKIPWAVINEEGRLVTDKESVLNRWKADFNTILNKGLTDVNLDLGKNSTFEHDSIKDCTNLNALISLGEVIAAIDKLKPRKAFVRIPPP
ncbi:hypothetical protein SNE40_021470 [Patella caerulea]